MGQGKSALTANQPLYEPSEFEVFPKRNDLRYGNILPLVSRQTGAEFAIITKTLQDEQELRERFQELEIREKLQHPNLIQMVRKNFKKQDDFCSTFYELGLLYEFHSGNLKNEFAERRNIGVGYHEGELWYIAESLLAVVYYLKSQSLTHSDIRPYNVMLTKEGQIKLGEVFMHSRAISGFSQILNHSLDEYYLSPQQFHRLRSIREAMDQDFDKDKSEIYSVGMTLLQAATLEDVSEYCYDKVNFVMSEENISKLLEIVSQQYSSQFTSFLTKMLLENEQERASVEELLGETQQPYVSQFKSTNITLVEAFKQAVQEQPQLISSQEPQEDEKVVRSAKPVAEEPVQQQTTDIDDLNARIQAVLALSRQTIEKYGVTPYETATVTTTAPAPVTEVQTVAAAQVVEQAPTQVETRTYVNQNPVTITTTTYQLSSYMPNPLSSDAIDEVIKRSRQQQQVNEVRQSATNVVVPAVNATSTSVVGATVPVSSTTYSLPEYKPFETTATVSAVQQPIQTNYVSSYSSPIEYSFNQNSYLNYVPTTSTVPVVQNTTTTTTTTENPTVLNYNFLSTNVAPATQSNSDYNEELQRIIANIKKSQATNEQPAQVGNVQSVSYSSYTNTVNN